MSSQTLNTAILKTLSYADIFDFSLTLGELHQYLIHSQPVDITTLNTHLDKLIKKRHICTRLTGVGEPQKTFSLPGRQTLFSHKYPRQQTSENKAKIGERVGKWLTKTPGLLAIYLTGATAVGNADKFDDIDLMIITKTGHVWPVRFMATLGLEMAGIRRKPENAENSRRAANKICLNLYLDTSHLKVPTSKQDLYTAHEVVQAKPLFASTLIHQSFLFQNRWVKTYLPNTIIPPKPSTSFPHSPSLLHPIAYRLQTLYMNKRRTNEFITSGSAYFHPRNTSFQVLAKYHQQLEKLGIKP